MTIKYSIIVIETLEISSTLQDNRFAEARELRARTNRAWHEARHGNLLEAAKIAHQYIGAIC
jgi:dihydrodipicolinate synthase/N-acetylneuraminate lyase